ncbi:hypothetical protein MRS76_11385 [Rhizobiaceae bacterium n13]|uniref:hypothetical protein n=1 Tax=Ferirhizobium litorale TaxID=2927786 RepID=UPI0024B2BE17|nr:hypothetical protein [Fererhizobium litorale]MDI7862564.1 hypothetical protein [Fererhizobium litorale]
MITTAINPKTLGFSQAAAVDFPSISATIRLYVSMLIDLPSRSRDMSFPSLTTLFPKVVSAMPFSRQCLSMLSMMEVLVIMRRG